MDTYIPTVNYHMKEAFAGRRFPFILGQIDDLTVRRHSVLSHVSPSFFDLSETFEDGAADATSERMCQCPKDAAQ